MTADRVAIAGGRFAATIDPLGAELASLRVDGAREILWQGDPAWWSGRAPLLFPVVGRSPDGRARWRGASFDMPPHGVARQSSFAVREARADAARFELRDDDATRRHNPFAFRLVVAYSLGADGLTMTASAENLSRDTPMPAGLGFHPGFAWPLVEGAAKTSHALVFDAPEPAPIRRIDRTGLMLRHGLPTPVRGRRLDLVDTLFTDDAIIFDRLVSRRVWFGVPGQPGLRVDFPDCPHLGVWMRPGAPYLCIEPWQGFAPEIGDDGDLARRPGSVMLPPGGALVRTLRIALDDVPGG
jgi:galactose mutarotase-like enzyme